MFCTNGVLLRMLVSKGISGSQNEVKAVAKENISDLTHIIVVFSYSHPNPNCFLPNFPFHFHYVSCMITIMLYLFRVTLFDLHFLFDGFISWQ